MLLSIARPKWFTPSRYTLTKSGFVIMSSEIGVLDVKPEDVIQHGRLEPEKCSL
jgi:glutamate synthase (ferredoxin)